MQKGTVHYGQCCFQADGLGLYKTGWASQRKQVSKHYSSKISSQLLPAGSGPEVLPWLLSTTLCASPSRRPFPLQAALSHGVYPSSRNQSRESKNSHWLLSKEKEASGSVLCLLEGKLLGKHYPNIEHHPKTFRCQCGEDKTLERLLFPGSKDPKSETWCFPWNEGALGSSWLVIRQLRV